MSAFIALYGDPKIGSKLFACANDFPITIKSENSMEHAMQECFPCADSKGFRLLNARYRQATRAAPSMPGERIDNRKSIKKRIMIFDVSYISETDCSGIRARLIKNGAEHKTESASVLTR